MMNLIQLLTTSEPTKGLLIPGGEHHGIGDEEGLLMMKIEDPPLRSPKQTPDLKEATKHKDERIHGG